MAELHGKLKRETGNNSSSEAVSPGGKIIFEVSNRKIESSADRNGKNFTSTLAMTEITVSNLNTRKAYEPRRVNNLVYFRKCSALETALNGIQSHIRYNEA